MKNTTPSKHNSAKYPLYLHDNIGAPGIGQSQGLSGLQKSTISLMNEQAKNWGFSNSNLKVERHKLDDHTWQLTVENPRTRKTILQVEGNGDKIFAHEDNLARMAEMLMEKDLKITTSFDK